MNPTMILDNACRPSFSTESKPLETPINQLVKRTFDILFAAAVLTVLSPVFLLLALLIRIDSRGPVFYRPIRQGKDGAEFTCFKFRTMYTDQCEDPRKGNKSTQQNDPRITRIGRILRKRDLDELPQFINVLLGDMSVVGPRPHRISLNEKLAAELPRYMDRHQVKPGVTGWAQVNGFRGPTQTHEQKEGRLRHDLAYIRQWTLAKDIEIIFLTVFGKKTRVNAF